MRAVVAVFHGTQQESLDLANAISRWCDARDGGTCSSSCVAHAAMRDQRFLDGVLFARFLRAELECAEFAGSDSLVSPRRKLAHSV